MDTPPIVAPAAAVTTAQVFLVVMTVVVTEERVVCKSIKLIDQIVYQDNNQIIYSSNNGESDGRLQLFGLAEAVNQRLESRLNLGRIENFFLDNTGLRKSQNQDD